jgi:hypothetical protein
MPQTSELQTQVAGFPISSHAESNQRLFPAREATNCCSGHSSNEIATKKAVNFWIIVLNLTVFRKHNQLQQPPTIPQGNSP